jgi:hypothetical protein
MVEGAPTVQGQKKSLQYWFFVLLQHLYASFISPKRSYWYVFITNILVSLTFCQTLSLSAAVEVVIPFARAAGSSAVVMAAVYSFVLSAVVVSVVVCAVDVRGVVVRAVVVSAAVVADAVVI